MWWNRQVLSTLDAETLQTDHSCDLSLKLKIKTLREHDRISTYFNSSEIDTRLHLSPSFPMKKMFFTEKKNPHQTPKSRTHVLR